MKLVYPGRADAAGLHGDPAGCGLNQQETMRVETCRDPCAGLGTVDFHAASADPAGCRFNAGGYGGCRGGVLQREGFAFECAEQGDEQGLAADGTAGGEVERGGGGGQAGVKAALVDVDADADDGEGAGADVRIWLGAGFDQDAAGFVVTDEQIVGPAEVDFDSRDRTDRIGGGES